MLGVVIVLIMILAGCSLASVSPMPSSSVVPSEEVSRAAPSSTERSVTPTRPPEAPVKKVAKPWKKGAFQKGVQVYWHTGGSDEHVRARATVILDYVVSLGANSVGLTFPLYTDGVTPTRVYAGKETPTPRELSVVIAVAHERGLRVMLRPILDEENIAAEQKGAWRGTIQPPNVEAWFTSYIKALAPYQQLAGQAEVAEFVVGVELFSLERYSGQWKRVKRSTAKYFDGELSFAVNWDAVGRNKMPFKALGLDMYPAVDLPDSASVGRLTRALEQWLDRNAKPAHRNIVIQEVGIAGIPDAYRNPWYWGSGKADSRYFGTQERWFEAAYRASKKSGMKGIYYWMVDSNQEFTREAVKAQSAGGFIGRPAEDAIRRSFTS